MIALIPFLLSQLVFIFFINRFFRSSREGNFSLCSNKTISSRSFQQDSHQNLTSQVRSFECHSIGDRSNPKLEYEEELLKPPILEKEHRKADDINIVLVSYASQSFRKAGERIAKEATEFGRFSNVTIYKPEDISVVFNGYFKRVISKKRGAGYWIWKIFVIRDAIERIQDGDYVMYVDAGSTIVKEYIDRFHMYMIMLERSKSGVLVTSTRVYKESQYNSGRLLEMFGILDSPEILSTAQFWSGFMILRKQQSVLDVLDKFLQIIFTDMWIITDAYGSDKSKVDFREHRHDQSIFSLLFKCFGCVVVNDYFTKNRIGIPVLATRFKNS